MQKFRRGDESWAFHPDRGWLRWDAALNDWVPQEDGPIAWAKSPFKRRAVRRLSKRQAALETLIPTNEEETRLLAHVLTAAEPRPDPAPGIEAAVTIAGVIPGNKEEARLLTHVLTDDGGPKAPLVFPKPRNRSLVTVLWVLRAVAIAGAGVLVYFLGRGVFLLLDGLFLPW